MMTNSAELELLLASAVFKKACKILPRVGLVIGSGGATQPRTLNASIKAKAKNKRKAAKFSRRNNRS